MAKSPLDLYENAYRLQYHDNRPAEAVKIYESIIRNFPDSNECAYSIIQLQKVKARDITKGLSRQSGKSGTLSIVAVVLSGSAVTIALAGILLLFSELRMEHKRTTLAISALGKMYSGDETGALKILEVLKISARKDALPFELAEDIYKKHSSVGTAFEKISGTIPNPEPEEAPAQPVAAVPEKIKKPAVRNMTKSLPEKNRTASSGAAADSTRLLVNPDSISYF